MKAFEEYKKNNLPWGQYSCPDREGASFEDGYIEGLEEGWNAVLKVILIQYLISPHLDVVDIANWIREELKE